MMIKINFKPVAIFFTEKTSFTIPGSFLNYIVAMTDRTAVARVFLKYWSLIASFRTNLKILTLKYIRNWQF